MRGLSGGTGIISRRRALLAIGLLSLSGAALPARSAERIVTTDLTGARVAPLEGEGRRATVLIFITNDCPIANGYAPEIERIYRAYKIKRIGFYLVYADASISLAEARKHYRDFGYSMPAVLDPRHRLVKAGSARVTPEAAVFGADGRLLYHGRIDDRAVTFGQVRIHPTRRDLRDCLDALLHGKPIPASQTQAVGCNIPDLGRP